MSLPTLVRLLVFRRNALRGKQYILTGENSHKFFPPSNPFACTFVFISLVGNILLNSGNVSGKLPPPLP